MSNSKMGVAHLVFYALVTLLLALGLLKDLQLQRENKFEAVGFPFDDAFGGRLKFFTFHNLVESSSPKESRKYTSY